MYHLTKLKNNAHLITIPVPGTKAVTVLVLVPVGSRYENKKISGASHFVEHLMFKGTKKRPTAQHISRELDAVGADYNAFTAKDYTGYYIKIDGAKQELAFDMLADMVFNSKFDAGEIDRERGVIVEELRMYEDNPIMAIRLLSDKLLFGDCPLGRDEGGSAETVKKISRDDLWRYYHSVYQPKNMVIAVAGLVDGKKMKKLSAYFVPANVKLSAPIIDKEKYEKFSWPKKFLPLSQRVAVKNKKTDQAQIMMSFPGLPNEHRDRHVLSLLQFILGGSMSSRLFVEVRERRGLAYMVHTDSEKYRETGAIVVRAGLNTARFGEAFKVIKKELEKISREGVTADELKKAKSHIAGRLALAMEESNEWANWYASRFWFSKEIKSPDEVLKEMNKVTQKEIKNLAARLFDFKKMRLAFIGPMSKQQVLKAIK